MMRNALKECELQHFLAMRAGVGFFLSLVMVSGITPAVPAFAQSNMIGTTGQFADDIGMKGAAANRQMADQLYQQALANEKAAWSTFPPNVSLLSKALSQSKDGKKADDQAKEFARAALHGINSAQKSGDLKASQYSAVDEAKLRDLATNNSQYTGQVQNKLGGYGLKLDPDQMNLQTPMGKFPIGMADDQFEKTLRGVASMLGYDPGDVSKGLRDAIRSRDEMGKAISKKFDLNNSNRALAGPTGAPPAGSGDGGRGLGDAAKAEEGASQAVSAAGNGANADDLNQNSAASQLDDYAKRRKAFLESMGVSADGDATARADRNADIFVVVHLRYQSIRAAGEFIEQESAPVRVASNGAVPVARTTASVKPASAAPANAGTPPRPATPATMPLLAPASAPPGLHRGR